jgi:hypothetical protein
VNSGAERVPGEVKLILARLYFCGGLEHPGWHAGSGMQTRRNRSFTCTYLPVHGNGTGRRRIRLETGWAAVTISVLEIGMCTCPFSFSSTSWGFHTESSVGRQLCTFLLHRSAIAVGSSACRVVVGWCWCSESESEPQSWQASAAS